MLHRWMFHVQNLATKVEGLQVKPGNKLLQITVTKWQHPNFYQRVLIEQCTTVLSYFFIRNRLSSLPSVSARETTPGHEQCESFKSEVWRPSCSSYTESSRKSCNMVSIRAFCCSINLTPGRPPVGWGLRPKHFWILNDLNSTENLRVRVFLGAFLGKKPKKFEAVLDSKQESQSWGQNWKSLLALGSLGLCGFCIYRVFFRVKRRLSIPQHKSLSIIFFMNMFFVKSGSINCREKWRGKVALSPIFVSAVHTSLMCLNRTRQLRFRQNISSTL